MCADASSLESCDCRAAFSARSFVRSEFAESSARLSRSTATFTNTTPASRIPLTAIQRIPPRARACARLRAFCRVRGRGRDAGSAIVACACERLANLRPHPQARRLRARVAGDLCRGWPDRAARRGAHRGLGAADADREVRRTRAALFLLAHELLDD